MSTDIQPKTINKLMRHLRNDSGIQIGGSEQKRQLIEYDQMLKSALYSSIMYLEMAAKNIVANETVIGLSDASFNTVYKEKMNDENSNKNLRLKRLKLRDKIHTTLSRNYGSATQSHGIGNSQDIMVSHFYNRGSDVPLWAIFEILTLGDFAAFCAYLNKNTRQKILANIHMVSSNDTNSQLLSNILYTIKNLRNSIAHNNVIFDTRFKDRENNNNVVSWLTSETGITNINFNYLTDYLILLCTTLRKFDCSLIKINDTIQRYEFCINKAYLELPINIYNKIISTEARSKMQKLKIYLNG